MSPENPSSKSRKIYKFWFPLILYSGIIFYGSSLPDVTTSIEGFNVDKLAHLLEYIPFGFLAARALLQAHDISPVQKIVIVSVFLGFLYGLSDEFHQLFVKGRESSLCDVLADTIGALLGSLLLLWWEKRHKKINN